MVEASGHAYEVKNELTIENSAQSGLGRAWILSVMTRANEIAGTTDTSSLIQGLMDLMIEISLADSANFFQLDPASDELVITHIRGDADGQHLIGLRINCQQGMPGIVLSDPKIMVVGDLPSEPDWLRAVDPVSAARKKNVINLPIASKDQVIGIVQIFNYQRAELDLLVVLGDRLAIEINRRKEVEKTRQSNQRLLTLVNILGEVAGTLDRNRLLHLVTENASRLVDAERSSIFLVDPDTREMNFQVAYQSSDKEQSLAPTDHRSQASVDPPQNGPSRDQPAPKTNSTAFQPGEFTYFNRSAITVPLRTELFSSNHADDRRHVMGGLMVLNKQSAAFQEEDAQLIRILADQTSTFLKVADAYDSAGDLFLGVIEALATAIDAKDPYTKEHSRRVSEYSVMIARELGLDETSVNNVRIGSLLHDIGKIGIPDSILLKNSKLSAVEMKTVQQHPRMGVNILSQVKWLEPMTLAILEHHERLDGSGYPAQLTNNQISWMGRIVAVADVYDAMTSDRPYRLASRNQEVLSYLHENAGIQFDPECVRAIDQIISRPDPAKTGNALS